MPQTINLECGLCGWIWLAERPGPETQIVKIACPRCAQKRTYITKVRKAALGHPTLPPEPPWLDDPEPRNWVTLEFAAREYFRKTADYVRREIVSGGWPGVPCFFDGTRWHIRLNKLPQTSRGEVE